MKHKIFTCIVLTAIILSVSIAGLMAQAKSTFAGDVKVAPATGKVFGRQKVTVAYNGDVYVARLQRLATETGWSGYQIEKSSDEGLTFTNVIDIVALQAGTVYTDMDIMACGNNAADFKLMFAFTRKNVTDAESSVSLRWYDSNGMLSGLVLDGVESGIIGGRGWEFVSLSSDTKDPAANSAPYSITMAAMKAGINDSIVLWTGNDGGTTYTRRSLAGTTKFIRNLSTATGTAENQPYGKVGIVWDEMSTSIASFGNIKAHFVWAQNGSDFGNSGPYDVGVTDNLYRRPVIAMANYNQPIADMRGVIAYESDASLSGNGVNIYCRQFDQLNGGVPQITTLQASLPVADGAGDQVNPHITYNPANDEFLYTYYNAFNDALVYKKTAINAGITTAPVLADLNYRDNQSAMTDPFPRVDGLSSAKNYFVWADQSETYIDMEMRWPAAVQSTQLSIADMKLSPNPATDNITLCFTSTQNDKASLSVTDIIGRIVQHSVATITKGSNKLPIALNNLPAGNYTLRMSGEHTNTAVMFTVQP